MNSLFYKFKNILAKPRGTKAADPEAQAAEPLPKFFRLSSQDQMLFIKRLAIMLKADVPILEALKMIEKQTSSKAAERVISDLSYGVQQGQSLHSRLEKYRKSFGDFALNIVRVGEVSGTLHNSLSYLADEIKKKRELRRKIVGALVYPIFIVVATIGITVLLTVYIFPKILPVLSSFKGQLPFTTRVLIFLSHFLSTKGWLVLLVLGAFIAAWITLLNKSPKFSFWVDSALLKLPVLGSLFVSYHMANFCRTLGILLKSDVRIVEAADVTARIATNLVYKKSLGELAQKISRGEKIADHLELNSKIFPPMVCQMVTVGESTGKLSDSLLYLAEVYENEVDEQTKNLSTSIEPLLMIFMGLLVGFIAMSIITPIYGLTQSLSSLH